MKIAKLKEMHCIQLINTLEEMSRSLNNKKQIDVIILDFEKAFDTVAHRRLLMKLEYYGVNGSVHRWIEQWLVGRTQCVVVEGSKSSDQSVDSGVPQGTVLGPIMFLIYINDIANGVSSSTKLFADDGLLFREITSQDDARELQKDLTSVTSWSKTWQMRFNPSKCHILRMYRGKKIITHDYTMLGHKLTSVENHPYLGVELDQSLSWKPHIDKITSKAHNTLNFLRRNMYRSPQKTKEAAYKTLVRPLVEYCGSAWDPGAVGQIKQVEAVQRKAARFVTGNWSWHTSVTSLLHELKWRSLQERRLTRRLVLMYQAHHGMSAVAIPPYVHQPERIPPRKHHLQYSQLATRINTYDDSFWPRTIKSWNLLPPHIIDSITPEQFRDLLVKAFENGILQTAPSRDPVARRPARAAHRDGSGMNSIILF